MKSCQRISGNQTWDPRFACPNADDCTIASPKIVISHLEEEAEEQIEGISHSEKERNWEWERKMCIRIESGRGSRGWKEKL